MTESANPLSLVEKAAQWLADQKEPPARVVPTLRERFSLTAKQACEACALAQNHRRHPNERGD